MSKRIVGIIAFTCLVAILPWAWVQDNKAKDDARKVIFNSNRLLSEWAYFQGQKEAIAGDVRIKYNESTKTYSWTKSPWDEGLTPIFDPSKSEHVSDFASRTNLLK